MKSCRQAESRRRSWPTLLLKHGKRNERAQVQREDRSTAKSVARPNAVLLKMPQSRRDILRSTVQAGLRCLAQGVGGQVSTVAVEERRPHGSPQSIPRVGAGCGASSIVFQNSAEEAVD